MIEPTPSLPAPTGSIIDTHAHYDDSRFDSFRDELFENFEKLGVSAVVNCGTDPHSSKKALAYAKRYACCYAAVGYHPENLPETDLDIAALETMSREDKVVAIGEIGLDYYWNPDTKEKQKDAFVGQILLAKQQNLPVIVHDRDAHGDTLAILKEYRPQGVVHCFSGSTEMAREVVRLGMYIGVGGVVTFKNAKKLCEVVADIPLERILLETDAPYMAPEPYRGKCNNSSLIVYVAEKIAKIKEIPVETVYAVTSDNAKNLFRF